VSALVDAPFDVSKTGFPYLAAAALTVCGGTPARLYRVSFSGELAYELGVPAHYGAALMRRIVAAGAVPYGTEARGVLRIEKGHPAGAELNGQTSAADLGLGGLVAKRKDHVGRALLDRPALRDPQRPVLVGLRPVDRSAVLRAGAHFLDVGAPADIARDLGHMTSTAYSPVLGHMIGLGLLAGGRGRIGQQVRAYDPVRNGDVLVEVCAPCFIDPTGERLRA
jgi:sarcosine oxidase subunit alpha